MVVSVVLDQVVLCISVNIYTIVAMNNGNVMPVVSWVFNLSRQMEYSLVAQNVPLTRPKRVIVCSAEGNCLFCSLSVIITGSEDRHMEVRLAICNYMVTIAHFLLGRHNYR